MSGWPPSCGGAHSEGGVRRAGGAALDDPLVEHIAGIALNRDGEHVGLAYRPSERYVYLTDTMSEPAEVDMAHPGS